MRKVLLAFTLLLLPLATRAQQPQPPPAQRPPITIAIRAGKLIDVDHSRVLTNQTILVRENGTIDSISVNPEIPPTAQLIDLSHETVFPGLIDCHTHLADGSQQGNIDPIYQLKHTGAEMALESVPNARVFLESGFTTVRDVGVYRALTDIALRDAIAKGYIVGPRMFVAGAYITISGGAGAMTGFAPDITLPWDLRYGQADSPWEVRQRVRQLVHDGADHIKILSSGAVLTHGSNPQSQEFTPEELAAAVDEAKHFGLRVASHAHSPEGIKNAIRAGVASVEHASLIDDEGIELLKQHGTYLVADVYDGDWIAEEGARAGWPAETMAKNEMTTQAQRDGFAKAVKAGARIAFGTDSGVYPHGRNAIQFGYQVRLGQSPLEAIRSATVVAAECMGWEDRVGAAQPGRFADLVAFGADPLADIEVLRSPVAVIKGGEPVG